MRAVRAREGIDCRAGGRAGGRVKRAYVPCPDGGVSRSESFVVCGSCFRYCVSFFQFLSCALLVYVFVSYESVCVCFFPWKLQNVPVHFFLFLHAGRFLCPT